MRQVALIVLLGGLMGIFSLSPSKSIWVCYAESVNASFVVGNESSPVFNVIKRECVITCVGGTVNFRQFLAQYAVVITGAHFHNIELRPKNLNWVSGQTISKSNG